MNGRRIVSVRSRLAATTLLGLAVLLLFQPLTHAMEATSAPAQAAPRIDLSLYFPEWARQEMMGVAIWQFLAAFVVILAGLVLKKISDFAFDRKIIPLLKRTRFAFDSLLAEAASKPVGWLLFLGGFGVAFGVLTLPTEPNVRGFVFGALKVLLVADATWFLFRLVDAGVHYLSTVAEKTESKLDDRLVPVIRKALKATIAVISFVWVIQLLGYNVSSLLAGLGIGGLAVALALQDTLANFFGSILIILDRPFAVGDCIKIGETEGIVEEIGFRSTRIRTWSTTVVAIPNKTVAAAEIDNWSKMPKRRVVQTVGVTYETTADQMERAVAGIREIVANDEGIDKELIVVRFTEFGESSLNIFVCYFTKPTALADHLLIKERINLAIMRLLKDMGLSIAFPTRSVYFEGRVAESIAERAPGHASESAQAKQG